MATVYSGRVWPPLIFPLPAMTVGGVYRLTSAPIEGKRLFAGASKMCGGLYPLATRPVEGIRVTPSSAVSSVNYTPAAPAPNTTSYVNPFTTQAATNSFFHIVAPTPGSGT